MTTDKLPQSRLDKLPRWASGYIATIERQLATLREHVQSLDFITTDREAEGLHLGGSAVRNEEHRLVPLRELRGARLVLADGSEVALYAEPDGLRLMHVDRHGRQMVVQPGASNVVTITTVPR